MPEYKNDGTDSAASFAQRAGDHHDGMHYFGHGADGHYNTSASDRGLLVMNHEAITPAYLHATGATIVAGVRTVTDEVIKELNVHGVSVVEVSRGATGFAYKNDSSYNRRITTFTDITLSGPAAKTAMMITRYSPDGSKTRGTVNNCANGYTPWGTYLTCEENWAGYFRRVVATDNPMRGSVNPLVRTADEPGRDKPRGRHRITRVLQPPSGRRHICHRRRARDEEDLALSVSAMTGDGHAVMKP